jgi:tRNA(Ile2) C34 agmatinyltransferase TiaS
MRAMAGAMTCMCGAKLVDEVTEEGVRPVGASELVRFSRKTDFVMCGACARTYDVRSLIARAVEADVIEALERMAAEAVS